MKYDRPNTRPNTFLLSILLAITSAFSAAGTAFGQSPSLGNYPNTIVQKSANITVTPSAAPTNATGISVTTDTNFNGVFVADPVTGVVRITNAHPTGNFLVTVKAFGPAGMATRSFTLTVVSGTACAIPVQFSGFTGRNLANNEPVYPAIGDFNNDGNQDLAVANQLSDDVTISLGDGAGGFTFFTNVNVGAEGPFGLVIADFNNDGNQDLAVASDDLSSRAIDKVTIRLGDGTGNFAAPSGTTGVISVANGTQDLAAGDFNKDGNQDLATANFEDNTVSILLGNGSGGFTISTVSLPANGTDPNAAPDRIVIGDFNNDGNPDFATSNYGTGGSNNTGNDTVSIGSGNGAGGFTVSNFTIGDRPTSLEIGDFNNDGNQDFLITYFLDKKIEIYSGNGLNGFRLTSTVPVQGFTNAAAIADFNNDGNQDFVATNNISSIAYVRYGNGTGNFSGTQSIPVGEFPLEVAVGDFNNDGGQDFVTANRGGGASILLGSCASVSPTPTPTPTPNTPPGANVTVASAAGNARVTFPTVSQGGFTNFQPLNPPSSAGAPPRGYTISDDQPGYDITTTATYTGPITVCFAVSGINNEADFARVRVLHGEGGQLVDRTILAPGNPAPNFATRTVCARVDTLSPFVIAMTSGQLLNISTRARVQTGNNVLIGGFIVTGTVAKKVYLRALGPSLGNQGVSGALDDPTLELRDGAGALVASNNDWMETQEMEIRATTIPPDHPLESAIVATLAPGAYTATVRSRTDTPGVGLVELYDLTSNDGSKLANISTRGFVQTGDDVMIGGFIIGPAGSGTTKVIARAIGPDLINRGIPGALTDTTLEIRDSSGALVAENDDWRSTQEQEIIDTTVPPNDDRESAIVARLPAGSYTAIVRGKGNSTGAGLVEVYALP